MKYKKFIINKYKAVDNVEINFKDSLIPIIGINESGKTSILQGILAFDKNCDSILNGQHLDAKNRYEYDSIDHSVTAEVIIENAKEKEAILNSALRKKNPAYQQVKDFLKVNSPIRIQRNIDTKMYDLPDLNCNEDIKNRIIDQILNSTPYLLYFDDFTDRVPDEIRFSNAYINNEKPENGKSNYELSEWNKYIEEIFYRATNKSLTLKDFLKIERSKDRSGVLDDVSDKLHEDVIKNWQKLKVLKQSLKWEIGGLTLKLDYEIDNNQDHIFSFGVIDKNNQDRKRHFSISERSKGFQWFFNFAIKLKYNTKYMENFENAIYLLDEPGSYLHSSAQSELLNALKDISKTNKVIYCTHTQHLLVPNIINIRSIKVAVRNSSSVTLQNFSEYKESTGSGGALAPLYHALQLNIGTDLAFKNNDILVTEGVVDYYFLTMILKHIKIYSTVDIVIIPGAGAKNLRDLISYSIAWSKRYLLLLDSDQEGRDAFIMYKNFFSEEECYNWFTLETPKSSSDIVIESLLSANDSARLLALTNNNHVKRAISTLFFGSAKNKIDFFKDLDSDSLSNIDHLFKKFSQHFK